MDVGGNDVALHPTCIFEKHGLCDLFRFDFVVSEDFDLAIKCQGYPKMLYICFFCIWVQCNRCPLCLSLTVFHQKCCLRSLGGVIFNMFWLLYLTPTCLIRCCPWLAPGLWYFIYMFRVRLRRIIEKLVEKRKPKLIVKLGRSKNMVMVSLFILSHFRVFRSFKCPGSKVKVDLVPGNCQNCQKATSFNLWKTNTSIL